MNFCMCETVHSLKEVSQIKYLQNETPQCSIEQNLKITVLGTGSTGLNQRRYLPEKITQS